MYVFNVDTQKVGENFLCFSFILQNIISQYRNINQFFLNKKAIFYNDCFEAFLKFHVLSLLNTIDTKETNV